MAEKHFLAFLGGSHPGLNHSANVKYPKLAKCHWTMDSGADCVVYILPVGPQQMHSIQNNLELCEQQRI